MSGKTTRLVLFDSVIADVGATGAFCLIRACKEARWRGRGINE